jgi:biopolymer transport protein ExbD
MAELTTKHQQQNRGLVKKLVKKTTRVDLTPMVDLGFLLITFFVFTSAISKPQVMNMMVPNDHDSTHDAIPQSAALTVVLGANNTVFYYEGSDANPAYRQTTYAADGLRKVLDDKRRKVMAVMGENKMILIIKPSDRSTFKNLVNVIDESAICTIKRYYIDAPDEADRKMIN